jgi:hypothetical protein
MGETLDIAGSREEEPSGITDAMKIFIDVLKRELDEEFRIAERLDAKARGYLTSATVAAAAAQAAAVAFITKVGDVPGVLAAVVAAIVLFKTGVAAHQVLKATRTHETSAFDIDYAKQLLPFAFHGDPVVVHNLADVMIRNLEDRRKANKERMSEVVDALAAAQLASRLIAFEIAGLVIAFGLNVWLNP